MHADAINPHWTSLLFRRFFFRFRSLDRLFRLKSRTAARAADGRRHPAVGTAVLPYCCRPHRRRRRRRQPVSSVPKWHITAVETTARVLYNLNFFFLHDPCSSRSTPKQHHEKGARYRRRRGATRPRRDVQLALVEGHRTPAGRPVRQRTRTVAGHRPSASRLRWSAARARVRSIVCPSPVRGQSVAVAAVAHPVWRSQRRLGARVVPSSPFTADGRR